MIHLDRYAREKTRDEITADLGKLGMKALPTTIRRMSKASGNQKTEATFKPGLPPDMKQARLERCLERQHWILDDWEKLIWSDETAVILGWTSQIRCRCASIIGLVGSGLSQSASRQTGVTKVTPRQDF